MSWVEKSIFLQINSEKALQVRGHRFVDMVLTPLLWFQLLEWLPATWQAGCDPWSTLQLKRCQPLARTPTKCSKACKAWSLQSIGQREGKAGNPYCLGIIQFEKYAIFLTTMLLLMDSYVLSHSILEMGSSFYTQGSLFWHKRTQRDAQNSFTWLIVRDTRPEVEDTWFQPFLFWEDGGGMGSHLVPSWLIPSSALRAHSCWWLEGQMRYWG